MLSCKHALTGNMENLLIGPRVGPLFHCPVKQYAVYFTILGEFYFSPSLRLDVETWGKSKVKYINSPDTTLILS